MTLPINQQPPIINTNQFMGSVPTSGSIDSLMPMLTNSIITITGMRDGNIINAIIGIIFLSLFNKIMAAIPIVISYIHSKFTGYFNRSRMNTYASIALSSMAEKRPTGTIVYEKIKDNQENIIVSALINYISSLDTCKFLIFNCDYYVGNNEEFQLKPDVMCRVLRYAKDDKGKICEYIFEIFSYVYDTEYLKNFVAGIVREYNAEKTNNLGKQSYYFNEIYEQIPKSMDGCYRFEMARKNISFDMVPFHTNKSLRNVFGEHLSIIKKRVDTFVNNPRWYEEKGIPYTLGIMLSGPPGTGKTSLIKAVAKDTRRHIFNISLRQTTTQTQLKNLFYNPEIHVLRNGSNEIVNIPLDKRLYVIEDIDCLTDIVISREVQPSSTLKSDYSTDIRQIRNLITPIRPGEHTVGTGSLAQSLDTGSLAQSICTGSLAQSLGTDKGGLAPPVLDVTVGTGSLAQSLDTDKGGLAPPVPDVTPILRPPGVGSELSVNGIKFDNTSNNFEPTGLSNLMAAEVNEVYGTNVNMDICGSNNTSMYCMSASRSLDEMFSTNLTGSTPDVSPVWTKPLLQTVNSNNQYTMGGTMGSTTGSTSACKDNETPNNITNDTTMKIQNTEQHPEQLNLSFLLNLLDGVLETPGRILIITTNHPEHLDKALIRPGRVDIHLQVGKCTQGMIIDILRFFYNNPNITISNWEYQNAITPAEVNKIILNNFDNCEEAIAEIRYKTTAMTSTVNQQSNDWNLADRVCGRE